MRKFNEMFTPIIQALHYLGGWAVYSELMKEAKKNPNLYMYADHPICFENHFERAMRYLKMAGLVEDFFFPDWIAVLTGRGRKSSFVDEDRIFHSVTLFYQKTIRIDNRINFLESDKEAEGCYQHRPDWSASFDDLDGGYWSEYFSGSEE